jgi:hypothetical protein
MMHGREPRIQAKRQENTMYKLYGRKGSGSFAVQVLLEEARAGYEAIWVDDVQAPSFLEINPNGRIPVLQLPDGRLMYESAAMMAFLAESLPAARMTPAVGSSARARMLQWLVFLSAGMYESNLRHFYPDRYGEAVSVKANADRGNRTNLRCAGSRHHPQGTLSVAVSSARPTSTWPCWRAGTNRMRPRSAGDFPGSSRSTTQSPHVRRGSGCRQRTPARPHEPERQTAGAATLVRCNLAPL